CGIRPKAIRDGGAGRPGTGHHYGFYLAQGWPAQTETVECSCVIGRLQPVSSVTARVSCAGIDVKYA
ncbi:hypothetical protein, partial [Xanthomonas phaseoli]|uniref:hypothetical protein n=1 Tax=Xanthomonas phaseoli TaxID=1985254 RepID=UPI001ED97764